MHRRRFIQGSLAGLAAFSVCPASRAAVRLNDTLSVVTGVGGNVVVLNHGDGLLLVDTGAAQHARELLAQIGSQPVRTVFNTHWHPDQTGSNEAFARSGAKIISHEKTRLWMATDHWVPAEDRYEKARPKGAQPTQTFYTSGKTKVGAENIEYGYLLEAHTDGDLYVHFVDTNVMAVGDAVSPEADPVFDWYGGGWIGGRLDSLALLLKRCDDKTKIVASTGPVVSRAEVQAEHDMMQAIYDRMVELVRKGYTTQDMLDGGVLQGLARTFKDPKKFMYDAHKGMWAHHNTLTHDVV